MRVTGVAPMVLAERAFIEGTSSASMIRESPIWISAWAMVLPGPSMRNFSVAPKAFL